MKNYDYIKSLTLEQLARLLCNMRKTHECDECMACDHCFIGQNGMKYLLESSELPEEWDNL